MHPDPRPDTIGPDDLAELFRAQSDRLERIVRVSVHAPDPLIEDACQVAWSRLVDRRHQVRRETALAWLATTASREALRQLRLARREMSLDSVTESAAGSPPTEEVAEQRERLGSIRGLPERQQRLIWLQGLGLSYTEMAGYTGATPRTVQRQLLRARHSLRAA